jgi:hypothetical protein
MNKDFYLKVEFRVSNYKDSSFVAIERVKNIIITAPRKERLEENLQRRWIVV